VVATIVHNAAIRILYIKLSVDSLQGELLSLPCHSHLFDKLDAIIVQLLS
jgi:hypothetical protein